MAMDEKVFMSECMRDQQMIKGKPHDQSVAICLSMQGEGVPYSQTSSMRAEAAKKANGVRKAMFSVDQPCDSMLLPSMLHVKCP
jgi:hypothetical protein